MSRARPRWVTLCAAALLAAALTAMLWPVLAAPVTADDRYWFLLVPGRTQGSYGEVVARQLAALVAEPENGRVASLAYLVRGVLAVAVTDVAVATTTPIPVYQGLVKAALLVAAVLVCLAFLRSLRRRGEDGALVAVSRGTVVVVAVGLSAFVAAGSQAHSQFRNAWTSYPVLTYGAVVVILGSAAVLLVLTRWVARGGRWATATAVLVLVVLAFLLNTSYELYYVAVPVALLSLLLEPLDDRPGSGAGSRRARLVTGGSFTVAFLVGFAWIRTRIAAACAETVCYAGVQPDVGTGMLRTAAYNALSAIPVFSRSELLTDLRDVGWQDRYPPTPSLGSLAVAVTAAVCCLLLWRAGGDGGASRGEVGLLLRGATVSLVAAIGTATVMGLSTQAQELVTAAGVPYRNTVVTWVCLCLTGVLVARATALGLPRPAAGVVAVVGASAVALLGAYTLPANLLAASAHRVEDSTVATETIHWEVVLGDTSPAGEQRRCASLDRLLDVMGAGPTRGSIVNGADLAFRHYHGAAYCPGRSPGGAVPVP